MSMVDMTVFEEFKEACLFDGGMDYFVYQLCESTVYPGYDYTNPSPSWRLRRENEVEYNRLRELHEDEYRQKHIPHAKAVLDKFGYAWLEQEGGGEGGSEYCYGVFQLGDKVYRAEYSYYSYNGHEFDYIVDTLREVTPKQKTITVYE